MKEIFKHLKNAEERLYQELSQTGQRLNQAMIGEAWGQAGVESGGVEKGHLPPLTLPKIFLFYVSKFYVHILFYFINIF